MTQQRYSFNDKTITLTARQAYVLRLIARNGEIAACDVRFARQLEAKGLLFVSHIRDVTEWGRTVRRMAVCWMYDSGKQFVAANADTLKSQAANA
jgi:hypothetical protein